MSIDETILDRARKLNEMRLGGTEHEMANAAELLARLLGKYNIKESELERKVALTAIDVNGKYNETWRKTVFHAAARLFYCHYFFCATGDRNVAVVHTFIGEPHNVAVATEIGKYFEATVNRLGNEAARAEAEAKSTHTNRHRFIRSFRLAAADRILARVRDYVEQAKAGKLIDSETGSNLPVMRSFYELQEQLYREYLNANNIALGAAAEGRDARLSELGSKLGYDAGENVSFTTQVPAQSRHALPSN